jgi:hypothetical protein
MWYRLRQIAGEIVGTLFNTGLTDGQKQENIYEKRQRTDA